jgi:predicted TIM-barrel fold metal-dependent hydrolase
MPCRAVGPDEGQLSMKVTAIDVHVHPRSEEFLAAMGSRAEAMSRYFGNSDTAAVSLDALADAYREREMMAVLVNTTDQGSSGRPPVPNDVIAAAVQKHSDVYLGMGIIEPSHGRRARDEIRRCREELGLVGIGELNPGRQMFFANDPANYPLWQEASDQGLVVMFHMGMMGAGAGTPGGSGYKLKYTRPIPYLDDVAADFPELTIIGAHPSWPWQEESLAIARHKSNFHIDLSGWSPKYFSESLVKQAGSILQDKVLFGSDWPLITPEKWLQDFEGLPWKPEVRQKVLLDNARRLFGLSD